MGQILNSKYSETKSFSSISQNENTIVLHPTECAEVAEIFKKTIPWEGCWADGISNEILKSCSSVMEEYLVFAINKSVADNTYPDCFNISKISTS